MLFYVDNGSYVTLQVVARLDPPLLARQLSDLRLILAITGRPSLVLKIITFVK